MRGGFGSRGRGGHNGFERPSTAAPVIETLEQALYPPTRQFYHFPPSMLSQASAAQQPRIPSSALELCQNPKPLQATLVYGGASARGGSSALATASSTTRLLFAEGPASSSNTVGTMEEVVSWYDAATCGRDGHPPKLAQSDPLVLRLLGGGAGQRQYGALLSQLPLELRIFSLEKTSLSDVERKQLHQIKQHKRPRLEKPVRRGGVVISAAAAAGRPSTSTSSSRKPKVSAFVDIAAAEGGVEEGTKNDGKRGRTEGGDDGSDRGEGGDADDGENSVSSMGDNADDDDAVDDLSGGGSGDELTF